jgi:hypothetical protein
MLLPARERASSYAAPLVQLRLRRWLVHFEAWRHWPKPRTG